MEKITRKEISEKVSEILKRPLFTLRLNYNSGLTQIMAFHSFTIQGGSYEWESPASAISEKIGLDENILSLGAENIEAIFQMDSYITTEEVISETELFDAMIEIYRTAGDLVD